MPPYGLAELLSACLASSSSPEQKVWSPAELRDFLEHVREDRLYALWLLVVTTGMRRGELAGLRWVDVDFDHATVSPLIPRVVVDHQVHDDDPAQAWPSSSQPLLPGPVGMYAAAVLTFWIPALAYGLLVRLLSPRAHRRRKQRGARWARPTSRSPWTGRSADLGAGLLRVLVLLAGIARRAACQPCVQLPGRPGGPLEATRRWRRACLWRALRRDTAVPRAPHSTDSDGR
jgi:integrase